MVFSKNIIHMFYFMARNFPIRMNHEYCFFQITLMLSSKPPKVDVPYTVIVLIKTCIFEWYMVWCGSKNRYQ
jgi:hypothetical protein